MPSMNTNYYSMLKQICKDCPYLIILPDSIHIDCDPPGGECKLEQEKKYGKL
jgi:hypothetical protein